jgi:hypothetical protein
VTAPLPAGKRGYFASTRAPRYSIIFALPLLVAYEGLAALLSSDQGGMRNGADALIKSAFLAALGPHGPAIFMVLVILIGVFLVARDMKRSPEGLRSEYFFGMAAEAVVLAIVFGFVIGTVTTQLLGAAHLLATPVPEGIQSMPWPTRLMLSLGAGLYEELFFRVILVSGLTAIGTMILGLRRPTAVGFSVFFSALIFSAFHYIPPYGDHFALGSFTFRFLSGLAFSGLFVLRGFGITAWTHALYDSFLLLVFR